MNPPAAMRACRAGPPAPRTRRRAPPPRRLPCGTAAVPAPGRTCLREKTAARRRHGPAPPCRAPPPRPAGHRTARRIRNRCAPDTSPPAVAPRVRVWGRNASRPSAPPPAAARRESSRDWRPPPAWRRRSYAPFPPRRGGCRPLSRGCGRRPGTTVAARAAPAADLPRQSRRGRRSQTPSTRICRMWPPSPRRRRAATMCPRRRTPLAGFGDDHQPLGAQRIVTARERSDAALADAGERAHRLFEFVRINVVAAADDDVLHLAGNEEFAVDEITAVAGIQPVVLQQARGRRGVTVIALAGRRPAKLHPPLAPLVAGPAARIDDPELVTRQGPPAAHDGERGRGRRRKRRGHAVPHQDCALDMIHDRPAAQRREREPHR